MKMLDLTTTDHLTLKRNTQLQKELRFRLQIITAEYRMTRRDLERYIRDVTEFLACTRHTAPGLSTYEQPDTRSMKLRSSTKEKHYQSETCSDLDDGSADVGGAPAEKKEPERRKYRNDKETKEERVETRDGGKKSGDEVGCSASSSTKHFVKMIAVNRKNGATLQFVKVNPDKITAEHKDTDHPCKKKAVEETHTSHHGTSISAPGGRTQCSRYGRDAYSQRDEMFRNYILSQFDAIFDPLNEKTRTSHATPATLTRNIDNMAATNPPEQGQENWTSASSIHTLERRFTWSAPHARQKCLPRVVASAHAPRPQVYRGNPQNNVAVPSGVTTMHRPSSALPVTSSLGKVQVPVTQQRPLSVSSLGEGDTYFPAKSGQQPQTQKRPKTAPSKYMLKHRSMSATRQQVAGILAEALSQTADTRTLLKKSKYLQEKVQTLAGQVRSDDSFSD